MTVKQIYQLAIKEGIKNDLCSQKTINEQLKQVKEKYQKLDKEKKKLFDKERLTNPYSDSRIHIDANKKSVKKVLVGIDITSGEVLLAKELGVDLIIGHHPVGLALHGLDDVMHLQSDVLEMYGVPINVAEGVLKEKISEVARGVHSSNAFIAIDVARNLGISFMNLHTPADNMVATFIKKRLEKEKPLYVKEILDSLEKIPEYQEAIKRGSAPVLYSGNPENRTGKIAVTGIAGGAEGSSAIYEKMANAGVGTIIAMHQSEKHVRSARKAHINVVIAPHIASDSIGMNLFLDNLEKKGIKIIAAGGFIRVKR